MGWFSFLVALLLAAALGFGCAVVLLLQVYYKLPRLKERKKATNEAKDPILSGEAVVKAASFHLAEAFLDTTFDNAKKAPSGPWKRMVLQSNMMLIFNEDAEAASSAVLMDGVIVSTPPDVIPTDYCWHPSYPLKIEHPSRELFKGQKYMYLYAKTGMQKEDWYYAIKRASTIRGGILSPEEAAFVKKVGDNFSAVAQPEPKGPYLAEWFNAGAHWIFWIISDSTWLKGLLRELIETRILRARDSLPHVVKKISVMKVQSGPRLPLVKSVEMLSADRNGAMEFDVLFEYNSTSDVRSNHARVVFNLGVQLPEPFSAFVPNLTMGFTLTRFAGKARLLLQGPPSRRIWIGFYEQPEIELIIETKVGDLQRFSIPEHLTERIEAKIQEALVSVALLPVMQDIEIPLVPEPHDCAAVVAKQMEEAVRKTEEGITFPERAATTAKNAPPASTASSAPPAKTTAADKGKASGGAAPGLLASMRSAPWLLASRAVDVVSSRLPATHDDAVKDKEGSGKGGADTKKTDAKDGPAEGGKGGGSDAPAVQVDVRAADSSPAGDLAGHVITTSPSKTAALGVDGDRPRSMSEGGAGTAVDRKGEKDGKVELDGEGDGEKKGPLKGVREVVKEVAKDLKAVKEEATVTEKKVVLGPKEGGEAEEKVGEAATTKSATEAPGATGGDRAQDVKALRRRVAPGTPPL